MASITEDPNGRKRVQFVAGDGKRKTIRLGKVSMRQAEAFKVKVEGLVGQGVTTSIDDEVTRWVESRDDKTHAKLAAVGLIKSRLEATQTALGKFVDDFTARQTTAKPNTLENVKQVRQWLVKKFGENRDIRTITAADAEDFRAFMSTEGLGDNTARRHIGRCRQIFKNAIRRKVVRGENPFEGIDATIRGDETRLFYITRAMADAVIEACPNAQWRLLVALSRYGGIRMPSEAVPLRWGDINWEKRCILITSPKTARHKGGASRMIPLFPELEKPLLDCLHEAPEGSEFVITGNRDKDTNLRTYFERIIIKAGLKPWPKLWHNMRSTRQTELSEQYPAHVVCKWIGNSEAVAREHYLQVRDIYFEKAAQNPTLQPSEVLRNPQTQNSENSEKPLEFAGISDESYPRQNSNLRPPV